MNPPWKKLSADYEEVRFSNNAGQFRQMFALGPSQQRLRARSGRQACARARFFALWNIFSSYFTFYAAHCSVYMSPVFPAVTHPLLFSIRSLFLYTLLKFQPHVLLQTVLLRLSAIPSPRAYVGRAQVLFPCNNRKRYLNPLLLSTRLHCIKLK